jgi:hypothetical protein
MEDTGLPEALRSVISSETYDFTLKAGHRRPFGRSFSQIIFGLIVTALTSVFVYIYLQSGDTVNAGNPQDSGTMVIILLSSFLIAGISILISGIFRAFSSGGYFVGTPKRLINFRRGKINSIGWHRFAGDILVRGNENKGTITLVMRPENLGPGESVSNYVPSVVYITSVKDPLEVEGLIRRRIKENDPTPATR